MGRPCKYYLSSPVHTCQMLEVHRENSTLWDNGREWAQERQKEREQRWISVTITIKKQLTHTDKSKWQTGGTGRKLVVENICWWREGYCNIVWEKLNLKNFVSMFLKVVQLKKWQKVSQLVSDVIHSSFCPLSGLNSLASSHGQLNTMPITSRMTEKMTQTFFYLLRVNDKRFAVVPIGHHLFLNNHC